LFFFAPIVGKKVDKVNDVAKPVNKAADDAGAEVNKVRFCVSAVALAIRASKFELYDLYANTCNIITAERPWRSQGRKEMIPLLLCISVVNAVKMKFNT
jgi:hypothetical protein